METKVNISMAISSLAIAIELLTIAQRSEQKEEIQYWQEEATKKTQDAQKWISGEKIKEI